MLYKSGWRLPNSSAQNKWAFNTAKKKVVDGVLDDAPPADLFAKSFVGRENKMIRKGGFGTQAGASLRLPNSK